MKRRFAATGRTYVGAIPGRIIHALQRCETRTPVLMLDEVDKDGRRRARRPTAALLEVLDPAQNSTFVTTTSRCRSTSRA